MGIMALDTQKTLAQYHKASELKKELIIGFRFKGGAMTGFMLARLRASTIQNRIGVKRHNCPPTAPHINCDARKNSCQPKPNQHIAHRPAIFPTHQFAQ